MDTDTAAEWCKEQGSQLALSVVVDIPADTWAEEEIRRAVRALAPEHRGSIMDIRGNPDISHTYVLFEWRENVPGCFQGASVKLTDEVEAQLFRPRVPRGEIPGAATPSPLVTIGPEFIRAIGDVLEQNRRTDPPQNNFSYRRLRTFSGSIPTPAGEETFEEWVEQAMQAMDEWDIPEAQRKQRLTESLRGPASEAVRNLKLSKRDCTAVDYLNILQEVFGRTEKAAELFFQYEHTYQERGEKMTEYMRRLDRILHQILLKKGAVPEEIDRIRMQQILRGAQPLDPVMLQLKTKEGGRELKYLELIRAVREEEALLEEKSSRKGGRAFVQPVRQREYPRRESESYDAYGSEVDGQEPLLIPRPTESVVNEPLLLAYTELHKTVAQVQEAQAEMKQAQAEMRQAQSEWCQVLLKVAETQATIQKVLTGMGPTKAAMAPGQGPTTEPAQASVPAVSGKRCFGCGEVGHFRAQCKSQKSEGNREEELLKVLKELLSTPPVGNARGPK